jgi:hypothetical protein
MNMNVDVIVNMVRAGKKPVVKLTSYLWDESWGEAGMIAEVTAVTDDDMGGDGYKLTFDYNRFKDMNLPLQSRDYWLWNGKTGTAFEAGSMKEDNISEDIYFGLGQDVPVILADNNPIMAEYVKSGFAGSYTEWLEKQLDELVPDCMKSWKKGF